MLHDHGPVLAASGARSRIGWLATAVTLALWLAVFSSADQSIKIDPSKGVVQGKTALSFWAVDGFESEELLHPAGLEVHLLAEGRLDEELVYPCGIWIAPPPGAYAFWIEGGWRISPASYVVIYRGSPFQGQGRATVRPVVPAGKVALAAGRELGQHEILRLLHTESNNRASSPRPEMSRRVSAENATTGALMPTGLVVAGIYDSSKREYLAVTRPFEVHSEAVSFVDPRPPSRGTDLLVVLERPGIAESFEDYDVALVVQAADVERPPDVFVPTADRMFAIWYGLEGKYAKLTVTSPSVFLEPQEIPLRPGKVESFRGALNKLPDLDVRVVLPPGFESSDEMTLTAVSSVDQRTVAGCRVDSEKDQYRFERLPTEELKVTLDAPPWRFSESVDLSSGEDGAVTFSPHGVRVSGTVFRGQNESPAIIVFSLWSDEKHRWSVETDEAGRYETTLFDRPYLAGVTLRSRPGGPFFKLLLAESFESDTQLDFHLPGNSYSLKVVDAASGKGIEGAKVKLALRRADGGESVRRMTTDGAGLADLPPIQAGELSLRAEAEDYEPAETVEQVEESDEAREILLALRKSGTEKHRLVLHLVDGSPAGGASVIALRSLAEGTPAWQGTCDLSGEVEIPDFGTGVLLAVKHPAAGFLIRPWDPTRASTDVADWTLPAVAPPLLVHVRRSWGDPAGWARLAIRSQGFQISGPILRWLVGGNLSDASGFWAATNLPPEPVAISAWMASDGDGGEVGPVASLQVEVAFPWPRAVEVETAN